MHPAIARLNWAQLNFRDLNSFESSFQSLINLLEQERLYVRQHTELLNKALEWRSTQKQTRYLLTGQERQQAEVWLKKRFKDKQPPCIPTDLHCEYITESIKNANNRMSQVFVCHAEQDRDTAERVRRTLMRAGITVWTHHGDIEFGTDFQAAMNRGLEEADNVVFLISTYSLESQYCRQDLKHALMLRKRIIPMLIETVDPDQFPESLQALQYIDLTENLTELDYQQSASNLLRSLNHNAAYTNEHKVLLTKALKWQRQQRNPCILLRGFELQHALAWIKISSEFPNQGPTQLQLEFIRESERQPQELFLDVFISYARVDSDLAHKLNDSLQRQGKRTWFDQESIASGADFQQEIYRGIESSNNFLLIMTPQSVGSPYCVDEVEYAAKLNKRIVSIRHRAVETADLHPELAKAEWIDFQENDYDFTASFQELIAILDAAPEYLRAHTQLLTQAIAWDRKGKRESLLLRGDELTEAEQWLLKASGKQPGPTSLQGDYIATSRQTLVKRQRRMIGVLSLLLVLSIGSSLSSLMLYREVKQLRQKAQPQPSDQSNYLLKPLDENI
ncbi:MAG: toll/interleukin-1 receptor domain-containing protein [Cyanobacteria bacterium P01_F01_bin.116]